MLTLNLSSQGEALLQRFAKEAGKTPEDYAEEIVIEHLADREDVLIAEQCLKDIKEGKSTTVSLEDVMKEYGMVDEI